MRVVMAIAIGISLASCQLAKFFRSQVSQQALTKQTEFTFSGLMAHQLQFKLEPGESTKSTVAWGHRSQNLTLQPDFPASYGLLEDRVDLDIGILPGTVEKVEIEQDRLVLIVDRETGGEGSGIWKTERIEFNDIQFVAGSWAEAKKLGDFEIELGADSMAKIRAEFARIGAYQFARSGWDPQQSVLHFRDEGDVIRFSYDAAARRLTLSLPQITIDQVYERQ